MSNSFFRLFPFIFVLGKVAIFLVDISFCKLHLFYIQKDHSLAARDFSKSLKSFCKEGKKQPAVNLNQ